MRQIPLLQIGTFAAIILVIGGLFLYASTRYTKECKKLMTFAQTHSDTVVVLASRPAHFSKSCRSQLNF